MASRKAQRNARRAAQEALQEVSPAPAVGAVELGEAIPDAVPAVAPSRDIPAQVIMEQEHEEDNQGQISYIDPNDIKKGSYILLRQTSVCKVVELNKSKPGKHGSAKTSVIAIDVFTGKKHEEIFCTRKAEVPEVKNVELEVVSLSPENLLTLRRKDGTLHPHRVTLEEDEDETSHAARARQMLKSGKTVIVQVMQTMGREKVVMAREKVSNR